MEQKHIAKKYKMSKSSVSRILKKHKQDPEYYKRYNNSLKSSATNIQQVAACAH